MQNKLPVNYERKFKTRKNGSDRCKLWIWAFNSILLEKSYPHYVVFTRSTIYV